jgi:hypothetical protein
LGLTVSSIGGLDGKIEIVGLGAVVALIQRWTIKRRAEDGVAGPSWTLHASFSYQNDVLMKRVGTKRRLTLKVDEKITYLAEAEEGAEWQVSGNSLTIEGVRVWSK